MDIFWLLIPLIICVEIANRTNLGNTLSLFLDLLGKIRNIFSYKKASDRWKEKALLGYSFRFLNLNFQLLIKLFLIFSPFFLILPIDRIFGIALTKALIDPYFLMISIPIVIAYTKIKKRFS
ncbi:MAG: hypothetical protein VW455_00815 [Nitrospinota bacterium]